MRLPFPERLRNLLPSALLFGGFGVDVLTFRTLQPGVTFAVLGVYAFAAAAGVVLGERGAGPFRKLVPLVVQFAFGALLSSALLFYWFGGAVAASWPIVLLVVVLMASNDRFRDAFLRPTVQLGVFAFVFFSYCTLLFPYLLRSVSPLVFVLGGAVATAGSLLVAEASARADSARRPLLPRFRKIAAGTFAAFVAAYFLNLIPPIPLSIRDAGIYHDVTVLGGEYVLNGEPRGLVGRLWPVPQIHLEPDGDGRIYAYTAIYAPTSLTTTVVHHWERYDLVAQRWNDFGRSSYISRGGREGGYRGYSYRTIREAGNWRVTVETERGQQLGRLHFRVVE